MGKYCLGTIISRKYSESRVQDGWEKVKLELVGLEPRAT